MHRPRQQNSHRPPPKEPTYYMPLDQRSETFGQPIAVPTANGRSQSDRHYPNPSPVGTGYVPPRSNYNNNPARGVFGQPKQDSDGWTRSGSMGSREYGRGGTGFNSHVSQLADDYGESYGVGYGGGASYRSTAGAGANVNKYKQKALERDRQASQAVHSASFHAGPSTIRNVPSPRTKAERQRRERLEEEANDADAVARRAEERRREAAEKARAAAEARANASNASNASNAPRKNTLSVFHQLEKQRSASTSSAKIDATGVSRKDARDAKGSRDDREKGKGKGKAKEAGEGVQREKSGKTSYLDQSPEPSSPVKSSKKRADKGIFREMRAGGEGFNTASRPSTPEPSSRKRNLIELGYHSSPEKGDHSARKKKKRDHHPSGLVSAPSSPAAQKGFSPVVSLADQFRAMQGAQEEAEGLDEAEEEDAANSDEEDELLRERPAIDYTKLCPFCNGDLPDEPSAKLLELKEYLISRPHAESIPTFRNPLAVRLPVAEVATFCKLHRDEQEVIPEGLAAGWPRTIDFEKLPRRIEKQSAPYLLGIILGTTPSAYLDEAKQEWSGKGKKMRNVMAEWSSFEVEQPGYYGPRGFEVMAKFLHFYYTDTMPLLTPTRTTPLDVDAFVRRVLVPECAISLVQLDLGLSTRDDAANVVAQSRKYGQALFDAVDDDERRESADARKAQMRAEKKEEKRRRKEEAEAEALIEVEEEEEAEEEGKNSPQPVAPKPAARKPKAVVDAEKERAEQAKAATAKGEEGSSKGKKREKEGSKKDNTRSAPSIASSATSRTSKSTALTIPSDESDSDIEITTSTKSLKKSSQAGHSKPTKTSLSPSSSISKAKSKPSSAGPSGTPSLFSMWGKENRQVADSTVSSAVELSSEDEVLDAPDIKTNFRKSNKASDQKGKREKKEQQKKKRAKEAEKKKKNKRSGVVESSSSDDDSD